MARVVPRPYFPSYSYPAGHAVIRTLEPCTPSSSCDIDSCDPRTRNLYFL